MTRYADFIGKVCDNSRLEPEIEKWFAELSDYTNAFKNCNGNETRSNCQQRYMGCKEKIYVKRS